MTKTKKSNVRNANATHQSGAMQTTLPELKLTITMDNKTLKSNELDSVDNEDECEDCDCEKDYYDGYEDGCEAGYDEGFSEGREEGYDEGYNAGLTEAIRNIANAMTDSDDTRLRYRFQRLLISVFGGYKSI
jgi:flagellar biosynthesis/type III secretory pathway protein FliH